MLQTKDSEHVMPVPQALLVTIMSPSSSSRGNNNPKTEMDSPGAEPDWEQRATTRRAITFNQRDLHVPIRN